MDPNHEAIMSSSIGIEPRKGSMQKLSWWSYGDEGGDVDRYLIIRFLGRFDLIKTRFGL